MSARQPICTCVSYGCDKKETTDERGNPIRGKRLGIQEYWEHRRGEKRLKYMREAGSPDRRQTGSNAPPNTTTSPQTTHCAGEPVGTQAWASQEDELARSLEDCLSVFRSGLLHDIRIEGLVFWEPSKEDDLRPPPPLQRLAKANTQFLEYREWIKKMLIDCQNLDCGTFERCRSIRDQLLHDIQNEWIKLDDLQLRAWQMASQNDRSVPTPSGPGPTVSDFGSTSTRVIDTSPHFEMPLFSSDVQPVVVVAHILVAVMHIASGLSLRDCAQLLFTIQLLISLMVEDFRATDGQGKYLAKSVPSDARTVIRRLALQPSSRVFVCCPKCSACYPDDGPDSYPEMCSSKHPFTQRICGRRLRKTRIIRGGQYHTPVRRYFYHAFNDWLGQMLCRPGMEDMMDRDTSPLSGGVMEDIWDAPGLYEIPGADGHPFICKRADNEG
ncbi:hypothetical protein EDB86DRAFT_3095162 [Lactarius hatsudake]|nr:hypothetical protein EDB86DRAFT_3095162 [Lactarius hatsudake]